MKRIARIRLLRKLTTLFARLKHEKSRPEQGGFFFLSITTPADS
jgi:hypothetical protein